jgi:hypothetical protein
MKPVGRRRLVASGELSALWYVQALLTTFNWLEKLQQFLKTITDSSFYILTFCFLFCLLFKRIVVANAGGIYKGQTSWVQAI